MIHSLAFHFVGVRGLMASVLVVGALGTPLLLAPEARADMCLSSGHRDPPYPNPDAGTDGGDAVSMNRKRNVGAGLLASASIATVWLSLRRSRGEKKLG